MAALWCHAIDALDTPNRHGILKLDAAANDLMLGDGNGGQGDKRHVFHASQ